MMTETVFGSLRLVYVDKVKNFNLSRTLQVLEFSRLTPRPHGLFRRSRRRSKWWQRSEILKANSSQGGESLYS